MICWRQRSAIAFGERSNSKKEAEIMATRRVSLGARIYSNRRIESQPEVTTPADGYLTRIVKYVPTEFISIFLAINNFVLSSPSKPRLTTNQYWIATAVLLVANAIYIYFATRQAGKPPATTQIIVSTVLYAVFIYSIGGPFMEAGLTWYKPQYAAVVLPVALFIAGFIVPNPIPVQSKKPA
jgi:hypothetical protein